MLIFQYLSNAVLLVFYLGFFARAVPIDATLEKTHGRTLSIRQGDDPAGGLVIVVEQVLKNAEVFRELVTPLVVSIVERIPLSRQVDNPLTSAYKHWDNINHEIKQLIDEIPAPQNINIDRRAQTLVTLFLSHTVQNLVKGCTALTNKYGHNTLNKNFPIIDAKMARLVSTVDRSSEGGVGIIHASLIGSRLGNECTSPHSFVNNNFPNTAKLICTPVA